MGLRLTAYTPERTSDEDAVGVSGFIVVLARLNDTMPAMHAAVPKSARAVAANLRTGMSKVSAGTNDELPHMSAAKMRTSRSGGIFSSRARIPASL